MSKDNEIIKVIHLSELSYYNNNIYKVEGFEKFNIVSEKSVDDDMYSIYRKGIFKFNKMCWLDEWFELHDDTVNDKICLMTRKEWENLKIEKEFIFT